MKNNSWWFGPAAMALVVFVGVLAQIPRAMAADEDTLTLDSPQVAGMSGFRAHWDRTIPVTENGQRMVRDAVVKDRGQTAIWGGEKPGPLAFDAQHRMLLVRFPDAAVKIAEVLSTDKIIDKVELILPYLDEEIWPVGADNPDFPCADGYRFRMNWDVDKLYRSNRPNWHAIAYALRKPWAADTTIGPTFNAAIKGAVYWKRFGASDTTDDRFPKQLGPAEVSSYHPQGRMDVTAVLQDDAYGKTLSERLRVLADCGFVLSKLETYDVRYMPPHVYEWAASTSPCAILIQNPRLVVTFKPGKSDTVGSIKPVDVAALAVLFKDKPQGVPTAVVPSPEEVARLNEQFLAKPKWMPDWQYGHVCQLMGLKNSGKVKPFYYQVTPEFVANDACRVQWKEGKRLELPPQAELDYRVYLAWLDWINGRPLRDWEGHLTAADNIMQWYNYRASLPAPVQDTIIRSWTAFLMPDRETELDPVLRRRYDDTSGKLVHPMVDDPRVGVSKDGKQAQWGQGDTYYKLTGDWRGNKAYYRSGFTREMSTANFNSSASSGALLNGQIIGSKNAMADGRNGLMTFPFWMWTHRSGVGQEYIDHYYWAIATAGNKNFMDFCDEPEDRMAGWSIITKTVNDLAGAYHPNLKKLLGPASRTTSDHILGQQDGLYHILHVLSPLGALSDVETGKLDDLTMPADANGKTPSPTSAWGHDYPPETVALQSMSGPWAATWFSEMIDEKPLPWSLMVDKEGDPVTTYFGENYGLTSIRSKPQRVHVLAHWRRKPERPTTMCATSARWTCALALISHKSPTMAAGVISAQGEYRTYQSGNKLIMLAKPSVGTIVAQASAHDYGQRKVPAQEIHTVQCTAALFNYEKPTPNWSIFIDQKKVHELPAYAKLNEVITIHDGVTYMAIRPLPTDDCGRKMVDVILQAGKPQPIAYHDATNVQPALLINALFYDSEKPLDDMARKKLESAQSGFVVEMGDVSEYGSFENFQKLMLETKLSGDKKSLTYQSGKETLVANWSEFTVNGADPFAEFKNRKLSQNTSLSQMGHAQLEKNGATIIRGKEHPELNMFLNTFPKQNLYVATNLLPCYLDYSFREPGGVEIIADGVCSMGQWAVKNSREIDIKYHAFGGGYLPKEKDAQLATLLMITGTKGTPDVRLNDKDVTHSLRPWKQDGRDGWLVLLSGEFPPDSQISNRLTAANSALRATSTRSTAP